VFFKGQKALQDAGVAYDQIENAFVGYVYGSFNFKLTFLCIKLNLKI
jgi:hypothetical protein